MPKRYLGSRSDKAIGYTVGKYCTYSIGLHYDVDDLILSTKKELRHWPVFPPHLVVS